MSDNRFKVLIIQTLCRRKQRLKSQPVSYFDFFFFFCCLMLSQLPAMGLKVWPILNNCFHTANKPSCRFSFIRTKTPIFWLDKILVRRLTTLKVQTKHGRRDSPLGLCLDNGEVFICDGWRWALCHWVSSLSYKHKYVCVQPPANTAINICSSNKCTNCKIKLSLIHSRQQSHIETYWSPALVFACSRGSQGPDWLVGWDVISAAAKWVQRQRRHRAQLSRVFRQHTHRHLTLKLCST